MKKWEEYSKQELIDLAYISNSINAFGKRIGYKKFNKEQGKSLFLQYPEILTILENNKNKNENLIGQRFGRLVVEEYSKEYSQKRNDNCKYWKCICDCGNIVYIRTTCLMAVKLPNILPVKSIKV